MTRTELKNYAIKMRRKIINALQHHGESCTDDGHWPDRAADETAYFIFHVLSLMRYLAARDYQPAKKCMSHRDFKGAVSILQNLMPNTFFPLAEAKAASLPDSRKFWAEIHVDFSMLFRDENPDVRTLGWLHQFYHSEPKSEIIRGVKRGKKITGNAILTATQIFTPEWIAEFLVQNTLLNGGKWQVPPDESGTTKLETEAKKPLTERTFCDPACGSGNMLLAAYDVFFQAYLAEGVPPCEIPEKILKKNLFGIDIDPRMISLTEFSLLVKAWEHDSEIFRKYVRVNVCAVGALKNDGENLDPEALTGAIKTIIACLSPPQDKKIEATFIRDLNTRLEDTQVGTLFRPGLTYPQATALLEASEDDSVPDSPLLELIQNFLTQTIFLTHKYDVVVTNPPYMGSRGMDAKLVHWLNRHYPTAKKDLFATFIVRNMEMTTTDGHLGFMTPFVWMFISSYRRLRKKILKEKTLTTLIQLEYSGFDGATVPICAFTLVNQSLRQYRGGYFRLTGFRREDSQAQRVLEALENPDCGWFFRTDAANFQKIPTAPLAYWLSPDELAVFGNSKPLKDYATLRQGCATSDNKRFLRLWFEVPFSEIAFHCSSKRDAWESRKTWFPYNKGGGYRKWGGNAEYVINWRENGKEIKCAVAKKYPYLHGNVDYVVKNRAYYFRKSLSWSKITSSKFSLRYYPPGFVFDVSGCSIFFDENSTHFQKLLLGCLNTPVMSEMMNSLAPTLNFEVGQLSKFPIISNFTEKTAHVAPIIDEMVQVAWNDWNSYETSWEFERHPAFFPDIHSEKLSDVFLRMSDQDSCKTGRMRDLQRLCNEIFLKAYSLDRRISPDVALEDVTLGCNPHYRYAGKISSPPDATPEAVSREYQQRFLHDRIQEFLSYVIGCIFGRYCVEKPGLILAEENSTLEDFKKIVTNAKFTPISNNILTLTPGASLTSGLTAHLDSFLDTYFGTKTLCENRKYLETILGKTLEKYMLLDFNKFHNVMYKKRPIYWMLTSRRRHFCAMIYVHRYHPALLEELAESHLLPLILMCKSQKKSLATSPNPVNRAKIKKLDAKIHDLETFLHETIAPLAKKCIKLHLNDGVLANYAKLGDAVRKIS